MYRDTSQGGGGIPGLYLRVVGIPGLYLRVVYVPLYTSGWCMYRCIPQDGGYTLVYTSGWWVYPGLYLRMVDIPLYLRVVDIPLYLRVCTVVYMPSYHGVYSGVYALLPWS